MSRLITSLSPQDIFDITQTAGLTDVGATGETNDGRQFRYVKTGVTLAPGYLYQSPAQTTGWTNLSIASAAIGAKTVVTTSTMTATLNVLAGGYLTVYTGATAQGYQYKIAGNTAASGAVCTIYLEDPLQAALTAATHTITVTASPYNGVVLYVNGTGTHTGAPVGVAVSAIPSGYYGWIQTKGPATVLGDSNTITVGSCVCGSKAVDGACGVQTEVTDPVVGTAFTAIASTYFGCIMLNLN